MQEVYTNSGRIQVLFNIIVNGQVLAQYKRVYPSTDSVVYFYVDYLGSRRTVINNAGSAIDRYRYSAWGAATQDTGSDDYRSFTGKDYDPTGLIYFNARYYDPLTGRFLTQDPAMKGGNWYAYCGNNPIIFVDPAGRQEHPFERGYSPVDSNRAPVLRNQPRPGQPMANSTITQTFAEHQAAGSAVPGLDMTSTTSDRRIYATHTGTIIYSDQGDTHYGFSATLIYQRKEEVYAGGGQRLYTRIATITEHFGHLDRPYNVEALVNQGPVSVAAGTVIGSEGNTGYVMTDRGGTHVVTDAGERAAGWGRHLHWDRKVGPNSFEDPQR